MTFKITWKDGLVITPWERPIGPTHGPSDPSLPSGSPVKDALDLAQDVPHSPLDQFAIKSFLDMRGGGKSVPNAWQSLVELIYDFVPNLGMIPYSFIVTSHFLITLGVPLPLAPFLVLLELIPHSFRALSSGIRLFANMMAGHSSVKILSGSAWTMLCLDFSAMIFPVVHIGAIAVSFLFIVMMFHIQIAEIHEEVLRYLPVSGIIGLILWWEMFFILDNETIPLLPTQRNTTSLRYTVYAGKVKRQDVFRQNALDFRRTIMRRTTDNSRSTKRKVSGDIGSNPIREIGWEGRE
ncbi:NADH-ubiquinone oxidoreductase chain [Arachis hypogaea]|nr:NADH-ubiquinone oxidoreductase chain [Arachis hypogaea]